MKISFIILLGSVWGVLGNSTYYNSFYGFPITSDDVAEYTANGTLSNCTNLIRSCNITEPRRIDGSCNNLNEPSRGAARTPYHRILDAEYNQTTPTIFDPKLAQDGSALRNPRELRTKLILDGKVADSKFTSLISHFALFFGSDVVGSADQRNYVNWRPYCCEEAGKSDPQCISNEVPVDDFVHRFSGINCLNLTRPLTYQTSGCLANTTTPLRIVSATPSFDLSHIYGNTEEAARRNFTGGLLNTDTVNGMSFPPSSGTSVVLIENFFGIIIFWRLHNYFATQLAVVNPNWTDEQLYSTAREINIAYAMQIFYYEFSAAMMNRDKLIHDGILSKSLGFRNVYDEKLSPQIFIEYTIALRWWHKMQNGDLEMFYPNGTYYKTYPFVNVTADSSFLRKDDNFMYIALGSYRQPSGKIDDDVADPDMTQNGLGALQRANDIMTNDLTKNRYFGLQSYVKYREYCFGDKITCFDDLKGIINDEKIERVKGLYSDVLDIDVLVGEWLESPMTKAHVPPTYHCLVSKQMLHSMISDRHWYESKDRPNPFTSAQLAQIRTASAACVMCAVGNGVTEIQSQAFLLPSKSNPVVSCDQITAMDFSAWAEE